jgi:DnaJ-class molecular chaperone
MADDLPTETVSCALCKGTGQIEKLRCEACDGNGQLLVVAPAIPCPRCNGTGVSHNRDPLSRSMKCAVCVGAGWARIVWDQPG